MATVSKESEDHTSLLLHQAIQQESERCLRGNTPTPLTSPDVPTLASRFRLTCPLCLENIKRPKQLDACFHIFCAECLKQIITPEGDGMVKCPTCQKVSQCPDDVTSWLDTDAYLHAFQGLISIYAESGNVVCSDVTHAEATPAAVFCLECGKNYCENCSSNHIGNDAFSSHHTLRLFKNVATMTVGTARRETLAAARDEADFGEEGHYQCPVCRNTAPCEHLKIIDDLYNDGFRKEKDCPIPSHADGSRLNAFCMECNEPICRNCSYIEHKDHNTVNIETASEEKRPYVNFFKKTMDIRREMFKEATDSAQRAEIEFQHHIYEVQKEMVERKGKMQTEVETAFNKAYAMIEYTGQKVAEINRQISEMRAEERFLQAAVRLAELTSERETTNVEIVRIWKGLDLLNDSLGGVTDKKHAKVEEVVVPQDIKEKRLVLPAPNCMTPDLSILEKVGVEGRVLELSFKLKTEAELLKFYSILPLTDTEALVACQPYQGRSTVVGYDNLRKRYASVLLEHEGQYCIVAVPGNGIVATHYQASGSTPVKKEILFWDQALDCKVSDLEARGAGKELKAFAETELPPRGVAVTKENHLVVCTADDPGASGDKRRSCILLMTLKGDVLKKMAPSGFATSGDKYFPRYATVNINGDVCVTDAVDRSVMILDGNLREKLRLRNPYRTEEQNKKFTPMGICHDSYGRLIVADPTNHTVLRFEVGASSVNPARVILQDGMGSARDMWDPTLVALGPGPKLWVVCRANIFVFDYMDPEPQPK